MTLKQIDKHQLEERFIRNNKLVLNPVIFRGDFIRNIAGNMNIIDNPERQLRKVFKLVDGMFAGVYCGGGRGEYIKHTGRKWQKKSQYNKRKGSNFITWEKKI